MDNLSVVKTRFVRQRISTRRPGVSSSPQADLARLSRRSVCEKLQNIVRPFPDSVWLSSRSRGGKSINHELEIDVSSLAFANDRRKVDVTRRNGGTEGPKTSRRGDGEGEIAAAQSISSIVTWMRNRLDRLFVARRWFVMSFRYVDGYTLHLLVLVQCVCR